MFSIPTFPKFLILAAVIFVVYMWTRRNAVQSRGGQGAGQAGGKQGTSQTSGGAPRNPAANSKQKAIEDLVKCPSCGTYIAAGSRCDCGQNRR
jgi:predicted lipid-binding transport protein (Tim44 family)